MKREIKVLRGIPGGGKSSLAKRLWTDYSVRGVDVTICSADDYFLRDGVYVFNYKKLDAAHSQCFRKYIKAVTADPYVTPQGDVWHGDQLIIVDNTNTTVTEMAPYVQVAKAFECPFEVITVDCPVEIAHARGLHNVPLDRVAAMQKRMLEAQLPKAWPHVVMKFNL